MEKLETIPDQEKQLALANFSLWNETLLSKDPQKVAELYAEDATFLPTVSKEFKKGQSGAAEYFTHFLEKNPVGEIIEDEVQPMGDGYYLHSGRYNFKVGPENEKKEIEARFSLVWRKNTEGKWEIIHHHSSLRPEE